MPTDRDFLAAVAARPADPVVRLAYADWLDERGDPRGELVRVEEELRGLPVWADRWWELQPRRDELERQTPGDWRERMRYGVAHEPVFRHGVPAGVRDRWRLVRAFVERWHCRHMGPGGGRRAGQGAAAERALGRALPTAVREWVAFAHDYFDGGYVPRRVGPDGAVSLLTAGDGAEYGVRVADLSLTDPPVVRYDWGPGWDHVPAAGPPAAAAVTLFALNLVVMRAPGAAGEVGVGVPDRVRAVRDLAAAFPARARVGEADVLEAANVLAVVTPGPFQGGGYVVVAVRRPVPPGDIPAAVWDLCRGRGSGLFAPLALPPARPPTGDDEVPF